MQHNRPEITMVLKQTNEVKLIDIAIPGDSRLSQKVVEKQTKYVDLKIEVVRLWKCRKVSIIPIIGLGVREHLQTDFGPLNVIMALGGSARDVINFY